MFRPEANRLSKFFEISALSISLAKSGGVQGKAGILRALGSQTSRRSVGSGLSIFGIGEAAKPRWWVVRESYLVAVDDPGDVRLNCCPVQACCSSYTSLQTEIYDVFMFDREFALEQPIRYYRKLDPFRLRDDGEDESDTDSPASDDEAAVAAHLAPNEDNHHPSGTLSRLSQKLHLTKRSHKSGQSHNRGATGTTSNDDTTHDEDNGHSAQQTKLDQQADDAILASQHVKSLESGKKRTGKSKSMDVSQHTFHIQNSQRRLKLVAKNEVRCDFDQSHPKLHVPSLASTSPMDHVNRTNGLQEPLD